MNKNKPHYVYISAILLDGKIWKWKIGLTEMYLINEFFKVPKELEYENKSGEEYREKISEFHRRFTVLNYPIWVNNLEEHNSVFKKAENIYKKFPIHENYCMGGKPYEE